MIPIFHTKTCAVHYQNDYVHVIKMLQNRKLDSGALTTLFLSRFETGVTETESHLQKELTHSNQLYYSLTYSNEILNAHVCYLEHKLHIVQREFISKLIGMEVPNLDDEQKKQLLLIHDFLTQKIQYDYQMAVKTKNQLQALIESKNSPTK